MTKVRPKRRSLRVLRNVHDRVRYADRLNQAGQTPYKVLLEHEIVTLRYYEASGEKGKQPVVIVPPLATNMLIYDLFPERSLVASLRDAGHPVYMIDWGEPGRSQAHYHFATYVEEFMPMMLRQVREHSGEKKLALHGWSLGALMSYSYAALGDPDIDKLVLLGPPCDYHAPNPSTLQNRILGGQLRRVQARTGWRVHRTPKVLWHVPGWANSLGFKLMSPAGTLRGYMELLRRLDDREFVKAHATNSAFLDNMVAYPGGVAQDILQYFITDNILAKGQLPVVDSTARLRDIRAKVLIIVGDKDPIVTPAASKVLVDLMENAECEIREVPGGHMSIVSGSAAPVAIWPQVLEWLSRTA